MKTKNLLLVSITLALVTLNFQFSTARAQGTTAFTYQGQLHDNGTNANGSYTMIFKLYDAVTSGNQIGSTITTSPTLANGLFTVNLDFGSAFTGSARWLDITVTIGATTQTLSPRVQVLPTPYAQFAAVAATVTNGAIMNAQLAGNAVNTTNIQNGAITTNQIASGQVVKGLNGLKDLVSLAAGANVILATNGNSLQISTTAGSGNVTAIDGNSRIIKGIINNTGTILYGSGFSASYSPAGAGGTSVGTFYMNSGDNAFTVNSSQRFNGGNNGYFFVGGGFYKYQGETYAGTNQYGVNFYYENFTPSYSGPSGSQVVTINEQLFSVYTVTFTTPYTTPPAVTATPMADMGPNGVAGSAEPSFYVNLGLANATAALSGFQAVVVRANITDNGNNLDQAFEFIAIGPQ